MYRKANIYDEAKNFVGLGKITFRASNFRKLFQSYLAMLTTNTKIVLIAAINLFISNKCYAQVLNNSSVLGYSPPVSTIVNSDLPFNSTGTFRLDPSSAFGDPWYLSIIVTERRDLNYVHGDNLACE